MTFGFGVNPLIEFHGLNSQPEIMFARSAEGEILLPFITNEWVMCTARVRIENGYAREKHAAYTWETENVATNENLVATSRTSFPRNARARMQVVFIGRDNHAVDYMSTWGHKFIGRWLSDDELRMVRDLDVREMQRRGEPRWVPRMPD